MSTKTNMYTIWTYVILVRPIHSKCYTGLEPVNLLVGQLQTQLINYNFKSNSKILMSSLGRAATPINQSLKISSVTIYSLSKTLIISSDFRERGLPEIGNLGARQRSRKIASKSMLNSSSKS